MVEYLEVQDSYGRPIGKFCISTWTRLPAIINWQGRTFQRYGRVGDYKYVEEPVVIVDASTIILD